MKDQVEDEGNEPTFKKPKLAPAAEEVIERTLPFEASYLRSIPAATQYEKSFMHRDIITHVIATPTDFIITASIDGHLKFWKKKYAEGIEFVKHFRCHLHAFSHVACNFNGTYLATVCTQDKSVKIFDIVNFDMINMIKLSFAPRVACWIHQGHDLVQYLAVSDDESGKIVILDSKGSSEPLHTIDQLHSKPVRLMRYNDKMDIVLSVDDMGMIEYWSGAKKNYEFPDNVKWQYKTDTDLYEFMKKKSQPVSLCTNEQGTAFAIVGDDRNIRIFDFYTAKLIKVLDESLHKYASESKEQKNYGLQNMEWNRRLAVEKELDKEKAFAFKHLQACFDLSGNFLVYPSPVGIKIYNVFTDKLVRTIGKEETVRFMSLSICRAVPDIRDRLQGAAPTMDTEAADNPNLNKSTDPDPILVCSAYKKNRFYLFTNAEPFNADEEEEGSASSRDVFNEKPKKEDQITAVEGDTETSRLTEQATLHTSMGDIVIRLHGNECPKTVENFCTHARRGYYNGLTFHRVIKQFMIQTGDPTSKGTGGQSIWGADFEDEFHPRLRHDKPFKVSMANAGPNSNGSQFFITVCPADWLDGKNTLFGEVVEGMNVVLKINQVQCYERSGRPKTDINLLSISLK